MIEDILAIVGTCLIITCVSCWYVYKWKKTNCCYDERVRNWQRYHCKCNCDGSCDRWCCCIKSTHLSAAENYDFEERGTRNERHDGGHEVDLRSANSSLPPAGTPAVTVQPLNDLVINRFVSDLDADQPTAVPIDDLPTFDQALQMEVVSSGAPTKNLMHQSSSKSDDLPPTYDAVEFHPVLLPGNTHYTYFDSKTVQPRTEM